MYQVLLWVLELSSEQDRRALSSHGALGLVRNGEKDTNVKRWDQCSTDTLNGVSGLER